MPNIRVTCPACHATLEIDSRHAGEEVECGSCLQVFVAKDSNARPASRPTAKPASKPRRRDDDDDYPHDHADGYDSLLDEYAPERRGSGGGALGVAALVLGIVALPLSCCFILSAPVALAGLIVGLIGMRTPDGRGLALAGVILSGIALLLTAAVLLGFGINNRWLR